MRTQTGPALRRLLGVVVLAAGISPAAQSQLAFHVTNLGTLGGEFSIAFGLNNAGQVVGASEFGPGNEMRAFLWQNGVMIDLGTLGGAESFAHAINDAGQVVGDADIDDPVFFDFHAFSHTGAGPMTDLGTLGGFLSSAYAVNGLGESAGQSEFDESGDVHAFAIVGGVMTDLGTLGGFNSGAYGINDAGQVVGASEIDAFGETHGFFMEPGGAMQDLGTLGGTFSQANAINQFGVVVGSASTTDDLEEHAFVWISGLPLISLGTLGGTYSEAMALNSLGWIVGSSTLADESFTTFLWREGVMEDLNTLLVDGSEWYILQASGVNDNGQISALGFNQDGDVRGLLLTAVPEPGAWGMLLGAGSGALLLGARRRGRRSPS